MTVSTNTNTKRIMRLIIALILAIVAVALAFKEPPQTFDAKPATSWKGFHASSKKGEIRVDFKAEDGSDDFVFAHRLDLVGDARTRGFAQGALLTKGKSFIYFFAFDI